MKPGLLIALAAGVGGLFLLGGSKPANAAPSPKPGEPGGTPGSALPGANVVPPADVLQKVLKALQSGDPKQMRQVADELERAGFGAQAADLRGAAAQLERVTGGGVVSPGLPTGSSPPSAPVVPVAVPVPVPLPPAPTPPPAPRPNDPALDLAGRTALMLNLKGRGTEDKTLVAQFQTQETQAGFYTGKIDGLYGPKSGLALAKHWGIIPPRPYYWSKVKAEETRDKASWRAQMATFAAKDPQRADEWTRAAAV